MKGSYFKRTGKAARPTRSERIVTKTQRKRSVDVEFFVLAGCSPSSDAISRSSLCFPYKEFRSRKPGIQMLIFRGPDNVPDGQVSLSLKLRDYCFYFVSGDR